MLCKSCPMPPIVVDIIFMCLVAFWIFLCNLPIASPFLSITLTMERLTTYLFSEPWPNFSMSTANQFCLLKPAITSSCYFWKVSIETFCVCKNGNYFVIELMMGWILIRNWQFIRNNFNKWSMKPQNSNSKNMLKLRFVHNMRSVEKSASTNKITNSGSVLISSRLGEVPP